MTNNPRWVVMLEEGHGYSPTRRKEFDNKKEAEHYYYLLQMSNFDNPYEVPVVISEYSH